MTFMCIPDTSYNNIMSYTNIVSLDIICICILYIVIYIQYTYHPYIHVLYCMCFSDVRSVVLSILSGVANFKRVIRKLLLIRIQYTCHIYILFF